MQFTPQQLTGGPKFHHRTKIGNWSEDMELEEIRLKDFLKKKETGSLMVTAKQRQLAEALVAAELTPTPDGLLRFGQHIMLVNHQSKGFLSVNPYDSVPKAHQAWVLTTSRDANPSARNVFELERADRNDGFEDDVVHYGQNFRCKLLPFASIDRPAYVHSELVTALAAAKFSRHQEVTAYGAPTGETLWQLLYPDTNSRFEMEGEPVGASTPLVIRHVQTGSFLASDEIHYNNLFGCEFEVHCFHYFSLNKTQNLNGEKSGVITGDYALRKHGMPNIWSVVADASAAGAAGTQRPYDEDEG